MMLRKRWLGSVDLVLFAKLGLLFELGGQLVVDAGLDWPNKVGGCLNWAWITVP